MRMTLLCRTDILSTLGGLWTIRTEIEKEEKNDSYENAVKWTKEYITMILTVVYRILFRDIY